MAANSVVLEQSRPPLGDSLKRLVLDDNELGISQGFVEITIEGRENMWRPIDSCSQIFVSAIEERLDEGSHDEWMSSDRATQAGDAEAAEATSNPNVNQRKQAWYKQY